MSRHVVPGIRAKRPEGTWSKAGHAAWTEHVKINVNTRYTAVAHWTVFFHACSLPVDDAVQNHRKHVSELDKPDCRHIIVTDFQNAT